MRYSANFDKKNSIIYDAILCCWLFVSQRVAMLLQHEKAGMISSLLFGKYMFLIN